MTPSPVPPPAASGEQRGPDQLDLLGQCAADLVVKTGHHAGLLLDEARFRLMKGLRAALFNIVISIAAVLACVVGYVLLVRETAIWLGQCIGHPGPSLVTMGVYLLAAVVPLLLLKLNWWLAGRNDLSALESRQQK